MICKHCGKEIDDKAVLCVHCGKMVNEKPKLPTGLIVFLWIAFLPIMAIITIVKSKKFSKKTKLILSVAVIVVTILFGIIGAASDANIEKTNYETIITTIENKNFEEAQDLIEDFIRDYPDSEYIDEINEQKQTVDTEVAKIEADKKAKEEQEKLKKEQEKLNAKKAENAKKAGVSVEAFENMINACKVIDIEYGKISNITAKNDWANGKRCSFDFSGYNFLVYFNQDGTVNSINSGTIKFYENGKKVEDLKDRLITTEEKTQIKMWAEEHVKAVLKAPSTAKFPGSFLSPFEDWSISKDGNKFTVSSYVDSQNGFGAMIRSDFTITYEWKDGTGKVVSMIFDGKKVV